LTETWTTTLKLGFARLAHHDGYSSSVGWVCLEVAGLLGSLERSAGIWELLLAQAV
jgi:hypothetical protein